MSSVRDGLNYLCGPLEPFAQVKSTRRATRPFCCLESSTALTTFSSLRGLRLCSVRSIHYARAWELNNGAADQAGNSVLAGLDGAASRLHLTARSFTGEDALHAYIEDDEVIAPNSESDLSPARLISVNGHGNILLVKPSRLSASHTTNGEAAQVPLVWLHSLTSNDARQILLPLPSSPIINVRAGSSFFLIQCEALLYSFGADNRFGQLGCKTERGTEATLREIDALAGMRLASLSVGDLHCAAIDAETAALYVWGSDGKGQCGGGGGDEPTLVSLPGLKDEDEQLDVLHVGCGANHTVIATSNGVWATGASAPPLVVLSVLGD